MFWISLCKLALLTVFPGSVCIHNYVVCKNLTHSVAQGHQHVDRRVIQFASETNSFSRLAWLKTAAVVEIFREFVRAASVFAIRTQFIVASVLFLRHLRRHWYPAIRWYWNQGVPGDVRSIGSNGD